MKKEPGINSQAEIGAPIVPATLSEFADAALQLSKMAASINWDGSPNTPEYLAQLQERIELVQAMVDGIGPLETKLRFAPLSDWKDIASAPRNKHLIVISKRFPEPHEAMLYDDGWFTWGPNGSYKDDPYLWTELPAAPGAEQVAVAKTQPVIVVWDSNGRFFQNWTAEFKNGEGIDHGRRIAANMGGTYAIVGDFPSAPASEEVKLAVEIERLKSDYPHLTPTFSGPHGDDWTCNLNAETRMYGQYGIFAGGGKTKVEALLDARRVPDKRKQDAMDEMFAAEVAKARREADERRADDAVFEAI
ncbi:hypothetical protein [Rhizobium sp. BK176]|uniref:hypothetical protein n=1 Tax=Rhizobium sp. BK176 TaxID=2587071 RepID=UPI0021676A19|nr:hypothetical protein [Rhizobium sp. BK176]MCS4090148.1 hypothetical protein [Rhizobium sp. BK176]